MQVILEFDNIEKSRVESRVENEKSRVEKPESRVENEKGRVEESESRVKILDLIKENPAITTLEMARKIGLTVKAVEKNLKILRDNGNIRHIGANRGGSWEILRFYEKKIKKYQK